MDAPTPDSLGRPRGGWRVLELERREDIVTTGITTTVVMMVAAMSPQTAWQQPLLRLVDTVVGISLGVTCKWIGSYLFYWGERRYARIS